MSKWKSSLAKTLADLLRLSIKVCLFINGILLALLSIYITYKFVLHVGAWANHTFFSSPW